MARIVVFSGNLSYSVRKGIVEINRAIPGLSWLVVLHCPPKMLGRMLRNQWLNLRNNGWRWIPYQATDLLRRTAARSDFSTEKYTAGSAFTPTALRALPNLRLLVVSDIHAGGTIGAVQDFDPDLGLSLAAPILRPSIFSIPRLGTMNLHKGRVPDYRGMPPAFWELWNDETLVGCTVHWVAQKLDTGAIVRETNVRREKHSSVQGLQLMLDEVGVALMRDAVCDALVGAAAARSQGAGGRTYRKPTLAQVATLERRLAGPGPGVAGAAKQFAKASLLVAVRAGTGMGLRQALAPRITVLLYHRVTDEVRDNLTVGIAQFDRQMALVRERCRPLSIEEVLSSSTIESSGPPLVAVTFDDGYLDNYANAAPILERHGIPAAFFVSTGIVNSNGRFPHDVRRGNPPIPVMSWNQIREMRDRGFTIGSHSVTHADFGTESDAVVTDELERSRDDLAREVGCTAPIFAYPYGGRANMTPARIELVKRAGFIGCLSAYGGSNIRSVDRYNVLRRGIHYEFDDRAFWLECHGVT